MVVSTTDPVPPLFRGKSTRGGARIEVLAIIGNGGGSSPFSLADDPAPEVGAPPTPAVKTSHVATEGTGAAVPSTSPTPEPPQDAGEVEASKPRRRRW